MGTVLAAAIAALVATFGYVLTARAKILEDRRKIYASALAAVYSYKALPHVIRRRADSTPATRGALGSVISNTQRDLDYYQRLLELDSPSVGLAYNALVARARSFGKEHRNDAWRKPPAGSDENAPYEDEYRTDDDAEVNACLKRMRSELRLLSIEWPRSIQP